MQLDIYQVDAFVRQTSGTFSGNPAAVVPLSEWLSDARMQAIAAENNLAETAFYVDNNGCYDIRWFTPSTEVDLCGHATLAAAHVIRLRGDDRLEIPFHCQVGSLAVKASVDDDVLWLDFPARPPAAVNDEVLRQRISDIIAAPVVSLHQARDLIAVVASEQEVQQCQPDLSAIATLDTFALVVTAASHSPGYDFISRFFAPAQGIDEDPVTGSSFCSLMPLWAEHFNQEQLQAWQCSARGGDVALRREGERILIGGRVFLYLQGSIFLP